MTGDQIQQSEMTLNFRDIAVFISEVEIVFPNAKGRHYDLVFYQCESCAVGKHKS